MMGVGFRGWRRRDPRAETSAPRGGAAGARARGRGRAGRRRRRVMRAHLRAARFPRVGTFLETRGGAKNLPRGTRHQGKPASNSRLRLATRGDARWDAPSVTGGGGGPFTRERRVRYRRLTSRGVSRRFLCAASAGADEEGDDKLDVACCASRVRMMLRDRGPKNLQPTIFFPTRKASR